MILNLRVEIASIIELLAALFSRRVWYQAQVLIVGAILATGKRTVTSILAVMGLSEDKHFQNYHRVLNRAVWSSLAASRVLPQIPVISQLDIYLLQFSSGFMDFSVLFLKSDRP